MGGHFWVKKTRNHDFLLEPSLNPFESKKKYESNPDDSSELKRQVKSGVISSDEKKNNQSGLENVGEDSALEEVLPQLDELQEKLIMLEDKVEHVTKYGATDAPMDAIIELTAKLKQEFQEFKSDTEDVKHVLEKVSTTMKI